MTGTAHIRAEGLKFTMMASGEQFVMTILTQAQLQSYAVNLDLIQMVH